LMLVSIYAYLIFFNKKLFGIVGRVKIKIAYRLNAKILT